MQTHGNELLNVEYAKAACLKDKDCKAVSLLNCNQRSVAGLCKEEHISDTIRGDCIYKKGKGK